jgi:lactate dehydrogenase-like 2-hydroxyacid dehydrogenase
MELVIFLILECAKRLKRLAYSTKEVNRRKHGKEAKENAQGTVKGAR